MKEIPFAKFRRNISRTLDHVKKTRKQVLITHSGQPLAVITPVTLQKGATLADKLKSDTPRRDTPRRRRSIQGN